MPSFQYIVAAENRARQSLYNALDLWVAALDEGVQHAQNIAILAGPLPSAPQAEVHQECHGVLDCVFAEAAEAFGKQGADAANGTKLYHLGLRTAQEAELLKCTERMLLQKAVRGHVVGPLVCKQHWRCQGRSGSRNSEKINAEDTRNRNLPVCTRRAPGLVNAAAHPHTPLTHTSHLQNVKMTCRN